MKKIICLFLLAVILMGMLSACALRCDICGKILPGKTYKTYDPNALQQVEVNACEDCCQDIGFVFNEF